MYTQPFIIHEFLKNILQLLAIKFGNSFNDEGHRPFKL